MKKITRSQRKALIEKGKTVLLVALCVCCAVLLNRVLNLFDEQNESGGVFWNQEDVDFGNKAGNENTVSRFRSMAAPEKLIIEHSKGKYLFDASDEEYAKLVELVETTVKEVYSYDKTEFRRSDIKDWEKALGGKVLYVKFPCAHRTDFEAQALSADSDGFPSVVTAYSELLFVPRAEDLGITVLVRARETEEFFSVETGLSSRFLNETIEKLVAEERNNCVFAGELNLDKEEDGKVFLESELVLPVDEMMVENIVSRIPETYLAGIDFTETTEFAVNLMSVFGYNPNTIRQYADNNGKLIFVSETGTVSVSPDGLVEYKALTADDGISLATSGKNGNNGYSVVEGLSKFNRNIMGVSGLGDERNAAKLGFVVFPEVQNSTEMTVKLDYYVDNCRVKLGEGYAVEAQIKNGILVEYRIRIKAISKTDSKTDCGDVFSAIDDFCEKNPDCKKITDCWPVYEVLQDEEETSAVWGIKGE